MGSCPLTQVNVADHMLLKSTSFHCHQQMAPVAKQNNGLTRCSIFSVVVQFPKAYHKCQLIKAVNARGNQKDSRTHNYLYRFHRYFRFRWWQTFICCSIRPHFCSRNKSHYHHGENTNSTTAYEPR